MSTKMLEATCDATGVVKVDGNTVPEAEVLSEGTKISSGALLIDKDLALYLTSSASDVKKVIEDLTAIIQKVIEIATGLDGATNSPGAQATNITALTTLKTSFEATKETLK